MTDQNDMPDKVYLGYSMASYASNPSPREEMYSYTRTSILEAERATHAAKEAAWEEREKVLVESLEKCLEWMEETRASGDAGYWDWEKGDVYSQGKAALQNKGE